MNELERLPEPPLPQDGRFTLYVGVQFRSSVSTGKLTISRRGVVIRLNPLLAWATGAKSLRHVLPTIKVEPTSLLPPKRQWLLIETADGYKAAVWTGTQIERLRQMFELVGVQVVPGEYGLRNQATKMLERPRPPRKDL